MSSYIWLFPLIFIFHDMEEIIGFGIFLKRNKTFLQKKYPWAIAPYKDFSTEGLSLAVFEELVLCIVFCFIISITSNEIISYLWLGGFIGCTLHFVIHIVQSIIIRKYIPALITSIICLPVSICIIVKCIDTITGSMLMPVTFMIAGIVIAALNLKTAQKMIGWFTRKMSITPII